MHSNTLVAVALAAAVAPAFAAPAPTYLTARQTTSDLESGAALNFASVGKGLDIATAVTGAANAAIDGFNWLKAQLNSRQDVDFYGDLSGAAITSAGVGEIFDVANKGVGAANGLADLAAKLEHLITGKREDVDPQALGHALGQMLANQQGKRQDTYLDDVSGAAITIDGAGRIFDVSNKGVGLANGLADLAAKIKHLITGKREDVDPAVLGQTIAELAMKHFGSTAQRREPFVIPAGSGLHPLNLPTLKNADGEPFTFHALARSLNELD